MLDKLGGRKFITTMYILTLAYALVFIGKLEAQVWLNMAVIAGGIYGGTNIAQKGLLANKKE